MEKWIGDAVGKMHINQISNIELAGALNVTPQYISEILNGKKTPKNIESRVMTAIDEIIAERTSEKTA